MDNRIKPIGYEYQDYKLGQKVRFKKNNKECVIIGFYERELINGFIAITTDETTCGLLFSKHVDSYLEEYKDYSFEWVAPNEIEVVGEDMEKEEVLKLEYKEVFDKVAIRVAYQDEEVLPRGEFKDEDLGIRSLYLLEWRNGELFILGTEHNMDNHIKVVSKEDAEKIKVKVERLNKKYGKPKRWRGKLGDKYFCVKVGYSIYIDKQEEALWNEVDDNLYEMGNYFKTKEEAQKVAEKIEKIFEEVRNKVE